MIEESIEEIEIDDCWIRIGYRGDKSCSLLAEHGHCHNCAHFIAMGRKLLDRPVPEGYLQEQTAYVSREKQTSVDASQSIMVFRLHDEWLALPTVCIRDVHNICAIHSLPSMRDSAIKGVVNVQGEVHVCISMSEVLSVRRHNKHEYKGVRKSYERLLVIRDGKADYVFIAAELLGSHNYFAEDVNKVPATVSKSTASLLSGVLVIEDRHVGLIDSKKLFATLRKRLS